MSTDKRWMGGVIYIQNLVKAIASLNSSDIELYLIIPSGLDPDIYNALCPFVHKICVEPALSLNCRHRIWWALLRKFPFIPDGCLSKIVKREKLDFLYPITGIYGFSWNFGCAWAAWIPDFQHKYLREFSEKKRAEKLDMLFRYMGTNAPAIMFSSLVALQDFQKFYPGSKSQTFVINFRTVPEIEWFALDPIDVQHHYQLPDRFFIVSNQFWKHKNHKIIIESLAILKKENICPVIVCTGNLNDIRFPGYGEEILKLIHKYELDDQIKIIGLIPRIEQIQLMRRSLAVIQPSLFEGWSTVVEDARVLGKAIILSDIPVHIEQSPPNSNYFRRNSSQDLADKVKDLLSTLIPGPDLSAEETAKNLAHEQSQIYAQNFIQIVQEFKT